MEPKTVQVVLSYYRKKYHLKQEDICGGICSKVTYSRLEQGERNVDSLIGEQLLDRIGKEVTLFETMLNEEDYTLWKMRDNILQEMQRGEYEEAEKDILQYRMMFPADNYIHEQFCLYQEVLIKIEKKAANNEINEILQKAIYITKPEYEKQDREQQLYTKTEINLIILYMKYSKIEKSISEQKLLEILFFIKRYYSARRQEEMGVRVLLELIDLQDHKTGNDKIIQYADEGIVMISQGSEIKNLAQLHFIKAQAMQRKYYQSRQWEEMRHKCYEECKMAYYVFMIDKQEGEQAQIQKFCEEILECPIIEQGILLD